MAAEDDDELVGPGDADVDPDAEGANPMADDVSFDEDSVLNEEPTVKINGENHSVPPQASSTIQSGPRDSSDQH
jgi:hypothetical protein